MTSRQQDQTEKFTGYRSLDLANKIYQVKALRLIENLPIKRSDLLPTLGSHLIIVATKPT